MTGLASVLGEDPSAAVAALAPDQQDELAALIAQALSRQRAELAASFESALKHVPFPLRPIVRKVLVG